MKQSDNMMCAAKYIACGMLIGSAVGTAATVILKSKKKPEGIRQKAASAMDTVGTIMQNLADFTR